MKHHISANRLISLALVLALLPVALAFAGIPASAAGNNRSVTIYRTEAEMTLDGLVSEGEEWDHVAWSWDFTDAGGTGAMQEGFRARFKSMWKSEGDARCLYYLIEVTDATPSTATDWTKDGFVFLIDETGERQTNPAGNSETSTSRRNGTLSTTTVESSPVLTYALRRSETQYTVELRYEFVDPDCCAPGGSVAFDLLIQDNCGTNSYRRLSWNGTNNVDVIANTGTGVISDVSVYAAATEIDGAGRSYTLYRADGEMTIDGVAGEGEHWENLPWSEPFARISIKGDQTQDFGARFKAMWDPEGYLYLLIDVKDATAVDAENGQTGYVWTQDGFIFCISESGIGRGMVSSDLTDANSAPDRRTSTLSSVNPAWTSGGVEPEWFSYVLTRNETGVMIEARYTFSDKANAAANRRILLDVMVQDSLAEGAPTNDTGYEQMWWNSLTGKTASNHGIEYAGEGWLSPVGASAVISLQTQYGAAVRLASPSGLRYETHIDKAAYDALVASGATVTTGTLILPTDYLTANGICAGAVSMELLDSLEITYLNIVNSGWANADTAETDGYYCWYGSIVNMKPENYDRAFTGVGYVTVTLEDGSSYTLYGGCAAAASSRSVRAVAQAAIDSGDYSDNEEALAILQGFLQ